MMINEKGLSFSQVIIIMHWISLQKKAFGKGDIINYYIIEENKNNTKNFC